MIKDSLGVPPFLPLLYTTYLSQFGVVHKTLDVVDGSSNAKTLLQESEVRDQTLRSYVYSLSQFLDHLDISDAGDMHNSSACTEKFVNHYLNVVLPTGLDSYTSLSTHLSALRGYFNWLTFFGFSPHMNIKVLRKTRQVMAEKSTPQNYIKYVTREGRFSLLNSCETLGEKLMMRMGFDVGLRTSELVGLKLRGKDKLSDIFEKLDDPAYDHIEQFRYLLEGKYTKRGKSRWIYFSKQLAREMKRYFDYERKALLARVKENPDAFFLLAGNAFKGKPIGVEQATRTFRRRAHQAGLNPLLSFHDLRHTFATELFHEEVTGPSGRETRSQSAALIVVAQRLGHSFTRAGHVPPSTIRYVRMQQEMLQLEKI